MTRALWILCLLATLGGCRFGDVEPPPPWSEAFGKENSLPSLEPAPLRVGVMLPSLEFDVRDLHREDESRHASRPDSVGFRRELIAALRAGKLFARAEPRGAPGAGLKEVEGEAWEAHDDLLLELEFTDYHQAFLGHGEGYFPWLLTYVSWIWPAWWIPAENFGGGAALRVRLRDVQGRHEPLIDEVLRVDPEDSPLTLTPIERDLAGFLDLGALWNLQGSLEESNWLSVERTLGPRTRRQLNLQLLRLLGAKVVAPLARSSSSLRARVRKRLGLAVGVSAGSDPRLGDGAHAEADATSMAELWATPAGGRLVPGRDLRTLVGEQATRSEVLGAIAAIGSQTSASDEVIVYIAGQGTTTPAGPGLLLHDANLDDLSGSSLLLVDLGASLRALPAENVLVIIDASFANAGPSRRTFRGTREGLEPERIREILALGPGRAVLLAAQPSQGARVLEHGEAGLFSQVLREGVAGRADGDGDARVTVRELYEYLLLEVPNLAALERHEQTPLAIGLPDLDSEDLAAQEAQFAWPR